MPDDDFVASLYDDAVKNGDATLEAFFHPLNWAGFREAAKQIAALLEDNEKEEKSDA